MKRIDVIVVLLALTALIVWTVVSGKDGFKSSNAMIVARSIAITSTIDGFVENIPPEVGTRIDPADLLIRIRDNRIDRGRLTDFDSEIDFLKESIDSARRQQAQLDELHDHFQKKATAHADWIKNDIEHRSRENRLQLEIAMQTKELRSKHAARTLALGEKQYVSTALIDSANAEAAISSSQVELEHARIERNRSLQQAVNANGAFFDNGDASYWDRMADEVALRQFDNLNRLANLNAQLNRAGAQAGVERTRIGNTVSEDHHAPFAGLVNAKYVNQGTRVTRGSSLLQLLDCSKPIVIVPLPEHRIAEFKPGMKVTVYPIDTDDALLGTIEYISSGPIIGHDQTLLVREELTVRGVRAVVSFSADRYHLSPDNPCQSAHRAVVLIHTDSIFRLATDWMANRF